MKNQLKNTKSNTVSIVLHLFNGKFVRIDVKNEFTIRTVDKIEDLELKKTDEVFKITDVGYEIGK